MLAVHAGITFNLLDFKLSPDLRVMADVEQGMCMSIVKMMSVAAIGLTAGACAGSNRFDGGRFPTFGPSPLVKENPAYPPAPSAPPVGQGIPRGPSATSLPPPVYPGSSGPVAADAPPPPSSGNVTVSELPPPNGAVTPAPNQPSQTERIVETRPQARAGNSVIGTWTARDGTGSTCKMTLSSAPALDLNKASASGCANKDLQRVNAWKQDGSEVYLYAAGTVVARLPAGSMNGVITRSGAPVTLSR